MGSARIALGLIFGMAVTADRALADPVQTPPPPNAEALCDQILYTPHITEDQLKQARDFFKGDEKASDPDYLKRWIIRNFDVMGGFTSLPDLTAHPLSGRKIQISIAATDGLKQKGESAPVNCLLPERGYFNPIGRRISVIRGDMAEATSEVPPQSFFAQQLPRLSARFHALVAADIDGVRNQDIRNILHKLEAEFDIARDMTRIGALLDDLWSVTIQLEDDRLSESAKAMRDAQALLEKAFNDRHGADDQQIKDFLDKAREGMDKFLDEQIKEAQEKGDKDLEKKLQELKQQLQQLQEAMEQKDKKSLNDALNMHDIMRQMMKAQQGQESLPGMMKSTQNMMQDMMQSLQRRLQDQKMLQGLEKMVKDQQQLLNDTSLTEEQRQDMMNTLRNGLDQQTKDMQDRARTTREAAELAAEKQKAGNAGTDKAEMSERARAFEKLGRQLQDAIGKRAQDPTRAPDQAGRLKDARTMLKRDLEKLKNPDKLDAQDMERILKDLERASGELDRLTDPQQAIPSESFGKTVDDLGRSTDRAKADRQTRSTLLRQMQNGVQDIKSIEETLKKLHQTLQNPDLDQKALRDAFKTLNDLQDRLAAQQKGDMSAIQKMIMALAAQLDDRVDEAGAYAYRIETGLRRANNTKSANIRAADRSHAVSLGEEISTIREDIGNRIEKNAPLTEDQAKASIARLKQIKGDLDHIDPRPQRQQEDQNQDGNGGGGENQKPMQPDELMQQLLEMMRNNNSRSQGQQQLEQSLQQMLQQSQSLQQKQQSLEQQLDQMRQQLQDKGLPKDQIDNVLKQMQDAAQKLQAGQPGRSMPGQNGSLQGLMQMQGQMQPGMGNGEGPGRGMNGSTGQGVFPPRLHDMTGGAPVTDPTRAGNATRQILEDVRKELDKGGLTPAVRKYYESLLPAAGPR